MNMLTHNAKFKYLYATPDASIGEFFKLKFQNYICCRYADIAQLARAADL
jgi:hypothetical protein